MKLIDVISAYKMIDSLADETGIGTRLAYKMTKFLIETQKEIDFYNASTKRLVAKYSVKEDGKVSIPPENEAQIEADMKKLGESEVDEPSVRFSLTELSGELKLTMRQIYPLMPFVDDDTSPAAGDCHGGHNDKRNTL